MGLGDLIEQTFKKVVDYVVELADDFADILKRGIMMIIHKFEEDFCRDWDRILPKEIRDAPLFKDWEKYAKEEAGKKPAPLGIFISSLIGSSVGAGVGMGMGGFGRDIQNWFNTIRPVTPLTADILAYGKHTGKITDEKFKTDLLSQGYAEEKHSVIYDYYKPKLSPTALLEAEKRIEKLDYDVTQALKDAGYNDKEIRILRELSWAYPSPTDFIRFAVRDVFVEDKETKEALEAEFPEPIVPYAEKAGMSKDVLMWYWKAHWELPSVTQVFEMLHRLNPDVLAVRGEAYKEMGLELDRLRTTKETVEFFLKQADYDKRWRQRLLAISYNPLTRVDLRRIYELGLIDDNELLARLMEVGIQRRMLNCYLSFTKHLGKKKRRHSQKRRLSICFITA